MDLAADLPRYRIVRPIARGGMAEVYLAIDHGTGTTPRAVALKQILPLYGGIEEFQKLFRDEARVWAALEHPSIVQIHEFVQQDGESFLVMEYVDGPDLQEVLQRCRRRAVLPPIGTVLYLAAELTTALDYAHELSIDGEPMELVHRDVSPPNVLLGAEGEIKLTDFGVAKWVDRDTRTRPGVLRGKFAYMSPEQVRSQDLDRRSDLFGLGVLLYETLTGVNPFRGETDLLTKELVEQALVEPPSSLRPDVPMELDRILMTCLSIRPEGRFSSAGELGEAIQALRQQFPSDASGMLQFLRDLFPEQTRARSTPSSPTEAPPSWLELAHRLAPAEIDFEASSRTAGVARPPIAASVAGPAPGDRPPGAPAWAAPSPPARPEERPPARPRLRPKPSPPTGAPKRPADDALLDSVSMEPVYTAEGVPILNEWDLVEESDWRDEPEPPVPTVRASAPPDAPQSPQLPGEQDEGIPSSPAEKHFFDGEPTAEDEVEWRGSAADNRLLWVAIAVLGPLIVLALGQAFKQ